MWQQNNIQHKSQKAMYSSLKYQVTLKYWQRERREKVKHGTMRE